MNGIKNYPSASQIPFDSIRREWANNNRLISDGFDFMVTRIAATFTVCTYLKTIEDADYAWRTLPSLTNEEQRIVSERTNYNFRFPEWEAGWGCVSQEWLDKQKRWKTWSKIMGDFYNRDVNENDIFLNGEQYYIFHPPKGSSPPWIESECCGDEITKVEAAKIGKILLDWSKGIYVEPAKQIKERPAF